MLRCLALEFFKNINFPRRKFVIFYWKDKGVLLIFLIFNLKNSYRLYGITHRCKLLARPKCFSLSRPKVNKGPSGYATGRDRHLWRKKGEPMMVPPTIGRLWLDWPNSLWSEKKKKYLLNKCIFCCSYFRKFENKVLIKIFRSSRN